MTKAERIAIVEQMLKLNKIKEVLRNQMVYSSEQIDKHTAYIDSLYAGELDDYAKEQIIFTENEIDHEQQVIVHNQVYLEQICSVYHNMAKIMHSHALCSQCEHYGICPSAITCLGYCHECDDYNCQNNPEYLDK